jgi:hypothetical protein
MHGVLRRISFCVVQWGTEIAVVRIRLCYTGNIKAKNSSDYFNY